MHSIESQIATQLLPIKNKPLVIGYSGGVDSCVLLHAVVRLKRQGRCKNAIIVCHVNHGLSVFSAQWQHHAELICADYNIPLIVKPLKLQVANRESLEAIARHERYLALSEVATKHQAVVLTGHHLDDQAETVLLALKRGSGVKGLSAMGGHTHLHAYKLDLFRPMLSCTRHAIEAYAKKECLAWVEDDSNSNTEFDRNFIRHKVLPVLTKRWPSITKTIARSAQHCSDAQQLLEALARDDLSAISNANDSINITGLMALSRNRIYNVLRFWINQRSDILPSQVQLVEAVKQIEASTDKVPEVKVGQLWLRRYQGDLYLIEDYQDISQWQQIIDISAFASQSQVTIELPDNLGHLSAMRLITGGMKSEHPEVNSCAQFDFSLPAHVKALTLRFNHNNPTCLPDYRQQSRKLKKVLQELNIPVWQRSRIPFVYCDGEIVGAVGYFVCQPFLPKCHTTKLSIHWLTGESSG